MNIIRLQVSEGKELTEICEFICELCLAPDTSSGAGVGCDNMTILIVAMLNGKTKGEWYDWIGDRVRQGYGFATPSEVPQIYAPSRLNAFRARRQASEDREREFGSTANSTTSALGFARSMLGGGISYNPATRMITSDGPLMFSGEDSDEESGEDDMDMEHPESTQSFLAALGLRPPGNNDVTKSLKAQLDELDDQDVNPWQDHQHQHGQSSHDDEVMSEPDEEAQQAFGMGNVNLSSNNATSPSTNGPMKSPVTQRTETPPPPISNVPNGVLRKDGPDQMISHPVGDEPSAAVKAEGLSDKSDDPLVRS